MTIMPWQHSIEQEQAVVVDVDNTPIIDVIQDDLRGTIIIEKPGSGTWGIDDEGEDGVVHPVVARQKLDDQSDSMSNFNVGEAE